MKIESNDIKLIKETTEPDRDGRKFVFGVKGRDIEVGISGTAINTDNFGDEDIIDRLTHIIKVSINSHDEEISIINIVITANDGGGWKVRISGRRTLEFPINHL